MDELEASGEIAYPSIKRTPNRFLRGIRPHIAYVGPLALLLILMYFKVVDVSIYYGSDLDALAFWGLIFLVVIGCGASVGILQLLLWSKFAIVPGLYAGTTRGLEKAKLRGEIEGFQVDKRAKVDLMIAELGGNSYVENPIGYRDFYVGVKEGYIDLGKVEIYGYGGDPCEFNYWKLPDRIRAKFAMEVDGKILRRIMPRFHENFSRIFLNFSGYDPINKNMVGVLVNYSNIADQQTTITSLRTDLGIVAKGRDKTINVNIKEPRTQQERPLVEQ